MLHPAKGGPHPRAFEALWPARFAEVFGGVAGAICGDGKNVDAASSAASPDCPDFADPKEAMGKNVDMKAVASWVQFEYTQALEIHALTLLALAKGAEELRPAPPSFCYVQHFGESEGPEVEMALPVLGDGLAGELERHFGFRWQDHNETGRQG